MEGPKGRGKKKVSCSGSRDHKEEEMARSVTRDEEDGDLGTRDQQVTPGLARLEAS